MTLNPTAYISFHSAKIKNSKAIIFEVPNILKGIKLEENRVLSKLRHLKCLRAGRTWLECSILLLVMSQKEKWKELKLLKITRNKVVEVESFLKMMRKKHKVLCALENCFHVAFY